MAAKAVREKVLLINVERAEVVLFPEAYKFVSKQEEEGPITYRAT